MNASSLGVLHTMQSITVLNPCTIPPSSQGWLSQVHSTLTEQCLSERCELLATMVLMYEALGTKASADRVLGLVRLLGGATYAGPIGGAAGSGLALAALSAGDGEVAMQVVEAPKSDTALLAEHLVSAAHQHMAV